MDKSTSSNTNNVTVNQKYFREAGVRLQNFYRRTYQNPHWALMYILCRSVFIRRTIKALYKPPSLDSYDLNRSMFQGIDHEHFILSLEKDGYCSGLQLPQPIVQQITDFATSSNCYGDNNYRWGFAYPQKELAEEKSNIPFCMGSFFNVADLCPVIEQVRDDPLLLTVAAKYLRTQPICTDVRLWWTFRCGEESYDLEKTAGFFHYDTDDYAALRIFFYLTDVDENSGPHSPIKGSHIKKKVSDLVSIGRRQDKAVIDYYGPQNVETVLGQAGAGFAEDPFCFHKGSRPLLRDRLILALRYAATDYKNILKSSADPSLLKSIFDPDPQ